ncbi:hypothetical protein BAUCODRAFT_27721 [Baudoinia panamericana UAMH 10762]|uniref:Altered inheritance of mitochondria protein 24, mitochondrial n=1 Tax=Baudoinia panamericana (strain UAMH 10762) TaxID=717646 RepID=M2N1C9_BAUPA|nr:uncharacterized protein BAUCODRAFT_27721 [Baudoinia panamericana UAMH 10762]EMC92440.1 hypothetical protein BAUCODRAFT_27721 [Baudoinia panamericana UAMH 10762]
MASSGAQYFPPPPAAQEQPRFDPPPSSNHQDNYFPPPSAPQYASDQRASFAPPPQFAPPPAMPPPLADGNVGNAQRDSTPSQDERTLPYYPGPPSNSYPPEKRREPEQPPHPMSPGLPMSPTRPFNTSRQSSMPGGAPPQTHFTGASATIDDVGTFNGGSYRISHRDTNTIVTIQLAIGCPLTVKPGLMIAMSPTMTLRGNFKFSMKKLLVAGEMAHSTYTGPGELLLGPHALGDVTNIRLTGEETWSVGRDAFMACTQGVTKDYKAQSLSKAMFSGEGLFVYKIGGVGIVWVQSMGAIIRKDLREGEKYIIDNGHLVAWNCNYVLERIASGGLVSTLSAGEGLVCKFTGPGTVFLQTRNPMAFAQYMAAHQV